MTEPVVDEDGWDLVADVVVVGSGAAGFAAAVAAANRGQQVVVLERAEWIGGTTAKAGGTYWIPNNHLMREQGMADRRDAALRYMARLSHPHRYQPDAPHLGLTARQHALLEVFYDNGSVMVEEFASIGALKPILEGHSPDYHADLAENVAPYGRGLRPDFVPDETGSTGGDMLIEGLRSTAESLGVEIRCGHRVTEVVRNEDGAVVGAVVQERRGMLLIRARRGVVFASGGFTHDAELAANHLRGPLLGGCAAETNTGDLIRIASGLGAELANMSHAWWSQTVLEVARHGPTIKDVWMPFGDSMIQVNRYGRRVVNEKMIYNERAQVHFAWSADQREYSNLVLFMVYDDAVARSTEELPGLRQPVPMPGEESGWVISGQTWAELADRIEERLVELHSLTGGLELDQSFVEQLRATVDQFNSYADSGCDPEFHRGETPIQLAWNGPAREGNTANPTMHRFAESGPYHAIILAPGALDTKGGPAIDVRGRITDRDGDPIPGLYGAGNCVASPAGQAYWAGGTTIGLALTFGHLAGCDVAQAPMKEYSFS